MLSCQITGGHGGNGGFGGSGGLGQPGGLGGRGGTNPKGDFGGNGGEGGRGGNSGAGGSGAGGYSFGVYLSSSNLLSDNSQFQAGVAGLAGPGGNNGQAIDVFPSYTIGTVDPLRQEQTLTIPNITSIDDCSAPIDFNVQASSGLEVEITTTSPIATINGHQISFSGNGNVVLNIVQGGNEVFAPVSTTVTLSVQCSGQSQTITFLPIGPKHITDPPFQIQATASSGLSVILELVNGPAELNGNLLTILGIGEVTIKATQPGNTVFAPAQDVIESFIVTKTDQVINFAPISDHSLGDPALALQATSTSGLPVTYFLSGPGVLTNNSLSLIGTGTISIIAIQNGNSNYNPAAATTQTFNVNNQNGSLIPVWFADSDADGFGNGNTTLASCIPLPGFVQNTDDCDDTNAAIKPGATEVKDGKDNNCNGQVDEGFLTPTILDLSITAVCADLPLISRRWKINNPNSKAVAVEWEIVGTIQKSWFEVPPGDSYLTALFVVGSSNTARIFWHNDIGQRKSLEKASITTKCSKSSTNARESMNDPAETNDQVSGKILNIYPNPGSTTITIEIFSEVEAKEPVELVTMGGVVKDEKVVQLGAGTNFITHDVSKLSTGVYLIKTKNQSIRFVKE